MRLGGRAQRRCGNNGDEERRIVGHRRKKRSQCRKEEDDTVVRMREGHIVSSCHTACCTLCPWSRRERHGEQRGCLHTLSPRLPCREGNLQSDRGALLRAHRLGGQNRGIGKMGVEFHMVLEVVLKFAHTHRRAQ